MTAPAAVGPFPRSGRGKGQGGAVGPSSNTGQKSQGAVIVDFLTVVVSRHSAEVAGVKGLRDLLEHVCPGAPFVLTSPTGRPRNFYPDHVNVLYADEDGGQLAGFIAFNDDACCISLTGVGCAGVRSMPETGDRLDMIAARITRCDIAYDDFSGSTVRPALVDQLWQDGAFNRDGRPPKGKYIDDRGTGQGCTAYVGTKGYQEVCCYDKGKQLGDSASAWTRLEARLYAKHRVLDTDMLRRPGAYLVGLYPILQTLLAGVIEAAAARCETIRQTAIATAKSMTTWLHRQCGRALGMLRASMPDDTEFAQAMGVLTRRGRPAKFRIPATAAELQSHLRATCHAH